MTVIIYALVVIGIITIIRAISKPQTTFSSSSYEVSPATISPPFSIYSNYSVLVNLILKMDDNNKILHDDDMSIIFGQKLSLFTLIRTQNKVTIEWESKSDVLKPLYLKWEFNRYGNQIDMYNTILMDLKRTAIRTMSAQNVSDTTVVIDGISFLKPSIYATFTKETFENLIKEIITSYLQQSNRLFIYKKTIDEIKNLQSNLKNELEDSLHHAFKLTTADTHLNIKGVFQDVSKEIEFIAIERARQLIR